MTYHISLKFQFSFKLFRLISPNMTFLSDKIDFKFFSIEVKEYKPGHKTLSPKNRVCPRKSRAFSP